MTERLAGIPGRLVAENLINVSAVRQALDQASNRRTTLVAHLLGQELIDTRRIAAILADEFLLPLLDIEAFDLSLCPEGVIDPRLIRKHRVLPLSLRTGKLFLAVSDPSDTEALNELAFHCGLKLALIVTEYGKLNAVIEQYLMRANRSYSAQAATTNPDEAGLAIEPPSKTENETDLDGFDETPLVKFINNLLLEAVTLKASDIHFEPYESIYRVRFRIDGMLQEMTRPPINLTARLASRIKIMAHLDIAEKRKPQDGRIRVRLDPQRTIDFRVNSLPTLWGEKIVMRVLDPLHANLEMHSLGMQPQQKQLYLEALGRHQGLILVTGPTGSGKSQTLYSGLSLLNTASKNIATVEDPVETTLVGVNQLSINSKTGLSFAAALRATLRQDPDVIMLGEIRDLESAETVLRAAQTGHLVLSTLHTLSAVASLNRLRDMGVPLYNLASTVTLVIAQRLARKLCDSCKESIDLPKRVLMEQGFTTDIYSEARFFRARGCALCRDGFRGRTGFFEVVPITDALSGIIMANGQPERLREHMRDQGLPDLRQAALLKVAQGLTSLDEANRLT